MMKKFKKNVKRQYETLYRKFWQFIFRHHYKVEDNRIMFEAFMGRKYSCSPRAIYEAMINDERYDDYTFVWAFKNPKKAKKIKALKQAKIVKYNSKTFVRNCSRAKYIVTNSRLPDYVKFRPEQKYVQCWHGTPLKRIGLDMELDANKIHSLAAMKKKYRIDAHRFTHLVSPSQFTTEKLTSAFGLKENCPDVKIVEEGYPRNDFLLNYTEADVANIKEKLHLEDNVKKVILYAPTWRDNQYEQGVGYTYEIGMDFKRLQAELGEEYIILFRAHYFVANKFNFKEYEGFIVNASKYEEINDLYIVADVLITDYSSVFFDYANLKKPIIFYMYDYETYKDDIRGFYIDINELPGPIVKTEADLITTLKEGLDKIEYDDKYQKFNDKYTYLDDGCASQRVLESFIET